MKKLLRTWAVVLFGMTAIGTISAQSWTEPVKPTTPQFKGTGVAPEDGGKYYIYNVGAAQFLGAGLDWGTRVVTTVEKLVTETSPVQSLSLNDNKIMPFTILEENGFTYIQHLMSDRGDKYVTHEDNNSWIDGGTSRRGSWTFVPVDGTDRYNIISDGYAEDANYFGVDGNNMGFPTSYTWVDLPSEVSEETTVLPYVEWQFISVDDTAAIRTFVEVDVPAYQVQLKVYEARLELFDALNTANEAGVATATAEAVYNNANATLEEVKNATSKLLATVNRQKFEEAWADASEENPLDVTEDCLVNADFSIATETGKMPPGWNITIKGQNLGQQNRTDGTTNEEKNYVTITNFIEAWIPQPQTLGDGVIAQTVYGMPEGKYVLEADAMATQQANTSVDVTGITLFIQAGSLEAATAVASPETQPKHWSVSYINDNSDVLTFGLKAQNTTANWISADNFKIYYYGKTEDSVGMAYLKEALEKYGEGSDVSNGEIYQTYAKVLADAQQMVADKAGSDECLAQAALLQQAFEAVEKSQAEYINLAAIIEEANILSAKVGENAKWGETSDLIADLAEEMQEKYDNHTADADYITSMEDRALTIARNAIHGDLISEGDDLTFLIGNADFNKANTASAWQGTSFTIDPNFHNAERYHATFNIYQTLTDMPAGSYTVTLQAFNRNDGNITGQLYAADATGTDIAAQAITEETAEWSETALFGNQADGSSDGNWPYDSNRSDITGDGTTVYIPGSMEGSSIYFATVNPATEQPFYLNTFTFVMPSTGDLRVGIRATSDSEWVLWDNFTITYNGNNASQYAELIAQLQEQVEEFMVDVRTNEAEKKAEAAIKAGTDALNSGETDACATAVEQLREAIAYIQAGTELIDKLNSKVMLYDEAAALVESEDESYDQLSAEIWDKLEDIFADNAEIEGYLARLSQVWTNHVMYGMSDGDDITAVIVNPSFEADGAKLTKVAPMGWTVEAPTAWWGVNEGTGSGGDPVSTDGNYIFGVWDSNTTLKPYIEQQIVLPAGTYKLYVDVHCPGRSSSTDRLGDQCLYAGENTAYVKDQIEDCGTGDEYPFQTMSMEFTISAEQAMQPFAVGFSTTNGQTECWFKIDNFRLEIVSLGEDGIADLNGTTLNTTGTPWYDLSGRRVSTNHRGIIVTTGRKVAVK